MAKQNENTKASSQENHVLQDILQKLNSINSHLTAQDQRLESMGELLKKQEQRLETLENTSMTQDNRITAASSKTCEIIDYLHSSPYKLNKNK
jgi:small-conductance mechanosensitive channel